MGGYTSSISSASPTPRRRAGQDLLDARSSEMSDTNTAQRCDLPVCGMTCASCAARIEKGLGGLPGVAEARVNFATNVATVLYDPDRTGPDDFRGEVTDLGYSVPQAQAGGGHDHGGSEETADEVRAVRRRLVGATIINLRHGAFTMDTLVSIGTVSAWVWSFVALVALDASEAGLTVSGGPGGGAHVYFETAGVVITLLLLGKFFEARARGRSGAALRALLELGAKTARLESGAEVPVGELQIGDRSRDAARGEGRYRRNRRRRSVRG